MSRTSHEPRTFFVTRSLPTIGANHSTFFTVRREFDPKGTEEQELARKYRLESGKQGHRQQVIQRGSKIRNFNGEFYRIYVSYFCHNRTARAWVVCYTAVFCVITQRSSLLVVSGEERCLWVGGWGDDTKNGCVAD